MFIDSLGGRSSHLAVVCIPPAHELILSQDDANGKEASSGERTAFTLEFDESVAGEHPQSGQRICRVG